MDRTNGQVHAYRLTRLRVEHDRALATQRASTPYQEPLPFGDGWLDGRDEAIEWHGTNVGLRLHAEADEPPCSACAGFLGELVDAGLARPQVTRVEEP